MTRVWLKRVMTTGAAVLCLAQSPAALAETLTDAFIAAYKNSNILDQNRALLRAADEDVVQALAGLKPVVSFVSQTRFAAPAIGC